MASGGGGEEKRIITRDRRYDGIVEVLQVTGHGVVQLDRFEREHAVQESAAAAAVAGVRAVVRVSGRLDLRGRTVAGGRDHRGRGARNDDHGGRDREPQQRREDGAPRAPCHRSGSAKDSGVRWREEG